MENTAPSDVVEPSPKPEEKPEDWRSFSWFLIKLVIVVLLFRSLVFTSFNIPSESMMPRLLVGDYLFAAKWPYGYSRFSLPLELDIGDGRLFASQPEQGDVVIFKHPIDHTDYIKRVIGLPGDKVQMVGGVLHLNGVAVKLEKVADYILPIRADESCARARFISREADGSYACRYPQFRETLPNGVEHMIIDFGPEMADDTAPVIVPEGHLFLMGDNRDNSLDSRFPAEPQRGIGLVPQENLVGRASFMYFSTDGSAEWIKPWTWFTAARPGRMFRGI
jgi:signal peptidase I